MMATTPSVVEMSTWDYCSSMVDPKLVEHLPLIPAAVLSSYNDIWTLVRQVIFIIVLLSGLEKRRFKGNYLNGRFGFVVPMEFLDGHRHRWSYTAASVAIAGSLLMMFGRLFSISAPIWATVFVVYLQGLEVAVLCFPYFACIGTRHQLVGGICNMLYTIMTLGINIPAIVQVSCQLVNDGLDSTSVITASALSSLPYILALLFLFIQSVRTIVRCLIAKQFIEDEDLRGTSSEEHHKKYLKVLLRKLPCLSKEESGWKFWQYRSMPGYLFPTRILCITAIVITLICTMTVIVHVVCMPTVHSLINKIEILRGKTGCNINNACYFLDLRLFFLRVVTVATYLAVVGSLTVVVANLLLFLRSYRRSIFKLFKGDKRFIITGQQSSQKYMAQSMRFMGYFIAYNLYGFIIVYVIVMVLCTLDGIAFEFLSSKGRLGDLFLRMLEISVFPMTAIFLFYGQTILAKYFLLQKKIHHTDTDPPLAVDNRKFYNVLSYYLLFVNVAVGVISCLARSVSSFILVLFQIGRLDKNLLLSGWHEKDRAYASYVAMLYVDYAHNHPALRVFCSLLWEKVLEKRQMPDRVTSRDIYVNIRDISEDSSSVIAPGNARSHVYVNDSGNREDSIQGSTKRRIFNRWQLTYTLLRNPSVISLRRPHPPRPEKTRVPEVTHHQSMTSRCHGWTQVIVYKISVASPLITIAFMVGIPVLTLTYFLF